MKLKLCCTILALAVATPWSLVNPAVAQRGAVEFIGTGKISGAASDLSGLSEELTDGTRHNQFGGISAIEWIPGTNRYLVLPDRGPQDGAVDYYCRIHEVSLDIAPGADEAVTPKLLSTTLLTNSRGSCYPGKSNALVETEKLGHRLDPEGIRRLKNGQFFVSDEYGPYLLKFSAEGKLLGSIDVPRSFKVAKASGNPEEEDTQNATGRRSNRGMEGLAISSDEKTLVGLMQSPLLQDSYLDSKGKNVGYNSRLVSIDLASGRQRQFVYRQDSDKHKMHDILAVDANQFLVIEQDGEGGDNAAFKKVMLIDLSSATEIPDGIVLPGKELPDGIRPALKSEFIDLLDPRFGLRGPEMPEKVEGLTWGPELGDGHRLLIISTDNDFRQDQDTMFFVFAVSL